jgi:hypothetical protein
MLLIVWMASQTREKWLFMLVNLWELVICTHKEEIEVCPHAVLTTYKL